MFQNNVSEQRKDRLKTLIYSEQFSFSLADWDYAIDALTDDKWDVCCDAASVLNRILLHAEDTTINELKTHNNPLKPLLAVMDEVYDVNNEDAASALLRLGDPSAVLPIVASAPPLWDTYDRKRFEENMAYFEGDHPLIRESILLRKHPSPIASDLGEVKRLALEFRNRGGLQEFQHQAELAGFVFQKIELGIWMKGKESEFIVSGVGLGVRPDHRVYSLVFKEGGRPSVTLVGEGSLCFAHGPVFGLVPTVGQMLVDHRARISISNAECAVFLSTHLSDETVTLLALTATNSLEMTREDQHEHGFAMTKSSTCYVVSVIPTEIERASDWFDERHGGYSKALEKCWNSAVFKNNNCTVLVHIALGQCEARWANLTVVPLEGAEGQFPAVFAKDLFSASEKEQFGLNSSM
ncbi:MAG TPA: hypothetical protein VG206_13400 [Terriglobia bacterium]|nr:hypothetical protein [Terriglobia bacterium]